MLSFIGNPLLKPGKVSFKNHLRARARSQNKSRSSLFFQCTRVNGYFIDIEECWPIYYYLFIRAFRTPYPDLKHPGCIDILVLLELLLYEGIWGLRYFFLVLVDLELYHNPNIFLFWALCVTLIKHLLSRLLFMVRITKNSYPTEMRGTNTQWPIPLPWN